MRRFPLPLFVLILLLTRAAVGQSPNGTISGLVSDPAGRVITGTDVLIVNDVTGVRYSATTNGEGIYAVHNIPPGPYQIQVSRVGFKTLIKPDVNLNVQGAVAINFTLPVGATSETLTVEGGAPLVSTESAAVSTVVDHKYVENMPLNGRSLQDLILLTPGVVTNSPQQSTTVGATGEFSVNGQRTESNYYTVDGVSANAGIYAVSVASPGAASGALPVSTALGTTQGLVSIDALQEFRIQSSTYSAEYGRVPGGQFSFVTRSGTNQWQGTAFDYLRNNVFDANDWFNNYYGQPSAPERQNDFGGTLGGPLRIPHLYDGKDRTFLFLSYEGLRLDQPQASSVSYVPNANLRMTTPEPLQQVLNAFPSPTPGTVDLGNGFGEFIGTWSNPSSIDSTSVRVDHAVSDKLRLFFRFSNTHSMSDVRSTLVASDLDSRTYTTRTYTLGATSMLSGNLSNELRLNYSTNEGIFSAVPTEFGGAEAVDLDQLQGFGSTSKPRPNVSVSLYLGSQYASINQFGFSGEQKQVNATDTVSLSHGRHEIRLGIDLRRLRPSVYQTSPVVSYRYFSALSVQANSVDSGFAFSFAPASPVYSNLSAFVQDAVRVTPRLTLSMGLRWEVNPAPSASKDNLPYTVVGDSLSSLSLAPQGTPLWRTTWLNFAPRIGGAYLLRSRIKTETVLRFGSGVFFDTGQQVGSYGYDGPGFSARAFFGDTPVSFPLPRTQVTPPIVNPPVAPYGLVYAFPAHLQLPFTMQWNGSIEQGMGGSQALSVSYVGATGRRLLEWSEISPGLLNPDFGSLVLAKNGHSSNYDALQLQYRRRLSSGIQALASYTWSHCIDYGSQDADVSYMRGNCDFDVRHNFSSALSYDLMRTYENHILKGLLEHWGFDNRLSVRSGFPVILAGNTNIDPATGQIFYSGLNIVSGQAAYVNGTQCAEVYNNGLGCPGNRAINPNAFSLPLGNSSGDVARNSVRGFGAWQMDVAVRREFPVHERMKLQFRAEAFNVFNHPNFGTINSTFCSPGPGCTFGQATATLANSLGGLSPLYQMGGPRSMQFALKFIF